VTVAYGETLSRDFKNARGRSAAGAAAFGGWTGLAIGLVAGILIGFALAVAGLQGDDNPAPVKPVPQRDAPASDADEAPARAPAAVTRRDYDFPEMLPRETVDVTPRAPRRTMSPPPSDGEQEIIDISPPA
jgi:hypothetical protein